MRGAKKEKLVEVPAGIDWKEFRRQCVCREKDAGARWVLVRPKFTGGVITHAKIMAYADRGHSHCRRKKAKPAKPSVKVRPPFRPTKRIFVV